VLTLTTEAGADPTTAADEADHSHAAAAAESSPGALALFLAILALLVAVGGVVLGWRANRRTVSS
jgi:hypothetical protein